MKHHHLTIAWILLCTPVVSILATEESSHHNGRTHHGGTGHQRKDSHHPSVPKGIQMPEDVMIHQNISCISTDKSIYEIMNKANISCQGNDMLCTFYIYKDHGYHKIGAFDINKEKFDALLMKYNNWLLTAGTIEIKKGYDKENEDLSVTNTRNNMGEYDHDIAADVDRQFDSAKEVQNMADNRNLNVDPANMVDDLDINKENTPDIQSPIYKKENTLRLINVEEKQENKDNHHILEPKYDKENKYFEVFLPKDKHKGKPRTIDVGISFDNKNLFFEEGKVPDNIPVKMDSQELANNVNDFNEDNDLENRRISHTNNPKYEDPYVLNSNICNFNANQKLVVENNGEKVKSIINLSHNVLAPDKYANHAKYYVGSELNNNIDRKLLTDDTPKYNFDKSFSKFINKLVYKNPVSDFPQRNVMESSIKDHDICEEVPTNNPIKNMNAFADQANTALGNNDNIQPEEHIYNEVDFDKTHDLSMHHNNTHKISHIHLNEPVFRFENREHDHSSDQPVSTHDSDHSSKATDPVSCILLPDYTSLDPELVQPSSASNIQQYLSPILPAPPIENVIVSTIGTEKSPFNVGISWLPSYSRIKELRLPPSTERSILSKDVSPQPQSNIAESNATNTVESISPIEDSSITEASVRRNEYSSNIPEILENTSVISPEHSTLATNIDVMHKPFIDIDDIPHHHRNEYPFLTIPFDSKVSVLPCPEHQIPQKPSSLIGPSLKDTGFIAYSPFDINSGEQNIPIFNQHEVMIPPSPKIIKPCVSIPHFVQPYFKKVCPSLMPKLIICPGENYLPYSLDETIQNLDIDCLQNPARIPCPTMLQNHQLGVGPNLYATPIYPVKPLVDAKMPNHGTILVPIAQYTNTPSTLHLYDSTRIDLPNNQILEALPSEVVPCTQEYPYLDRDFVENKLSEQGPLSNSPTVLPVNTNFLPLSTKSLPIFTTGSHLPTFLNAMPLLDKDFAVTQSESFELLPETILTSSIDVNPEMHTSLNQFQPKELDSSMIGPNILSTSSIPMDTLVGENVQSICEELPPKSDLDDLIPLESSLTEPGLGLGILPFTATKLPSNSLPSSIIPPSLLDRPTIESNLKTSYFRKPFVKVDVNTLPLDSSLSQDGFTLLSEEERNQHLDDNSSQLLIHQNHQLPTALTGTPDSFLTTDASTHSSISSSQFDISSKPINLESISGLSNFFIDSIPVSSSSQINNGIPKFPSVAYTDQLEILKHEKPSQLTASSKLQSNLEYVSPETLMSELPSIMPENIIPWSPLSIPENSMITPVKLSVAPKNLDFTLKGPSLVTLPSAIELSPSISCQLSSDDNLELLPYNPQVPEIPLWSKIEDILGGHSLSNDIYSPHILHKATMNNICNIPYSPVSKLLPVSPMYIKPVLGTYIAPQTTQKALDLSYATPHLSYLPRFRANSEYHLSPSKSLLPSSLFTYPLLDFNFLQSPRPQLLSPCSVTPQNYLTSYTDTTEVSSVPTSEYSIIPQTSVSYTSPLLPISTHNNPILEAKSVLSEPNYKLLSTLSPELKALLKQSMLLSHNPSDGIKSTAPTFNRPTNIVQETLPLSSYPAIYPDHPTTPLAICNDEFLSPIDGELSTEIKSLLKGPNIKPDKFNTPQNIPEYFTFYDEFSKYKPFSFSSDLSNEKTLLDSTNLKSVPSSILEFNTPATSLNELDQYYEVPITKPAKQKPCIDLSSVLAPETIESPSHAYITPLHAESQNLPSNLLPFTSLLTSPVSYVSPVSNILYTHPITTLANKDLANYIPCNPPKRISLFPCVQITTTPPLLNPNWCVPNLPTIICPNVIQTPDPCIPPSLETSKTLYGMSFQNKPPNSVIPYIDQPTYLNPLSKPSSNLPLSSLSTTPSNILSLDKNIFPFVKETAPLKSDSLIWDDNAIYLDDIKPLLDENTLQLLKEWSILPLTKSPMTSSIPVVDNTVPCDGHPYEEYYSQPTKSSTSFFNYNQLLSEDIVKPYIVSGTQFKESDISLTKYTSDLSLNLNSPQSYLTTINSPLSKPTSSSLLTNIPEYSNLESSLLGESVLPIGDTTVLSNPKISSQLGKYRPKMPLSSPYINESFIKNQLEAKTPTPIDTNACVDSESYETILPTTSDTLKPLVPNIHLDTITSDLNSILNADLFDSQPLLPIQNAIPVVPTSLYINPQRYYPQSIPYQLQRLRRPQYESLPFRSRAENLILDQISTTTEAFPELEHVPYVSDNQIQLSSSPIPTTPITITDAFEAAGPCPVLPYSEPKNNMIEETLTQFLSEDEIKSLISSDILNVVNEDMKERWHRPQKYQPLNTVSPQYKSQLPPLYPLTDILTISSQSRPVYSRPYSKIEPNKATEFKPNEIQNIQKLLESLPISEIDKESLQNHLKLSPIDLSNGYLDPSSPRDSTASSVLQYSASLPASSSYTTPLLTLPNALSLAYGKPLLPISTKPSPDFTGLSLTDFSTPLSAYPYAPTSVKTTPPLPVSAKPLSPDFTGPSLTDFSTPLSAYPYAPTSVKTTPLLPVSAKPLSPDFTGPSLTDFSTSLSAYPYALTSVKTTPLLPVSAKPLSSDVTGPSITDFTTPLSIYPYAPTSVYTKPIPSSFSLVQSEEYNSAVLPTNSISLSLDDTTRLTPDFLSEKTLTSNLSPIITSPIVAGKLCPKPQILFDSETLRALAPEYTKFSPQIPPAHITPITKENQLSPINYLQSNRPLLSSLPNQCEITRPQTQSEFSNITPLSNPDKNPAPWLPISTSRYSTYRPALEQSPLDSSVPIDLQDIIPEKESWSNIQQAVRNPKLKICKKENEVYQDIIEEAKLQPIFESQISSISNILEADRAGSLNGHDFSQYLQTMPSLSVPNPDAVPMRELKLYQKPCLIPYSPLTSPQSLPLRPLIPTDRYVYPSQELPISLSPGNIKLTGSVSSIVQSSPSDKTSSPATPEFVSLGYQSPLVTPLTLPFINPLTNIVKESQIPYHISKKPIINPSLFLQYSSVSPIDLSKIPVRLSAIQPSTMSSPSFYAPVTIDSLPTEISRFPQLSPLQPLSTPISNSVTLPVKPIQPQPDIVDSFILSSPTYTKLKTSPYQSLPVESSPVLIQQYERPYTIPSQDIAFPQPISSQNIPLSISAHTLKESAYNPYIKNEASIVPQRTISRNILKNPSVIPKFSYPFLQSYTEVPSFVNIGSTNEFIRPENMVINSQKQLSAPNQQYTKSPIILTSSPLKISSDTSSPLQYVDNSIIIPYSAKQPLARNTLSEFLTLPTSKVSSAHNIPTYRATPLFYPELKEAAPCYPSNRPLKQSTNSLLSNSQIKLPSSPQFLPEYTQPLESTNPFITQSKPYIQNPVQSLPYPLPVPFSSPSTTPIFVPNISLDKLPNYQLLEPFIPESVCSNIPAYSSPIKKYNSFTNSFINANFKASPKSSTESLVPTSPLLPLTHPCNSKMLPYTSPILSGPILSGPLLRPLLSDIQNNVPLSNLNSELPKIGTSPIICDNYQYASVVPPYSDSLVSKLSKYIPSIIPLSITPFSTLEPTLTDNFLSSTPCLPQSAILPSVSTIAEPQYFLSKSVLAPSNPYTTKSPRFNSSLTPAVPSLLQNFEPPTVPSKLTPFAPYYTPQSSLNAITKKNIIKAVNSNEYFTPLTLGLLPEIKTILSDTDQLQFNKNYPKLPLVVTQQTQLPWVLPPSPPTQYTDLTFNIFSPYEVIDPILGRNTPTLLPIEAKFVDSTDYISNILTSSTKASPKFSGYMLPESSLIDTIKPLLKVTTSKDNILQSDLFRLPTESNPIETNNLQYLGAEVLPYLHPTPQLSPVYSKTLENLAFIEDQSSPQQLLSPNILKLRPFPTNSISFQPNQILNGEPTSITNPEKAQMISPPHTVPLLNKAQNWLQSPILTKSLPLEIMPERVNSYPNLSKYRYTNKITPYTEIPLQVDDLPYELKSLTLEEPLPDEPLKLVAPKELYKLKTPQSEYINLDEVSKNNNYEIITFERENVAKAVIANTESVNTMHFNPKVHKTNVNIDQYINREPVTAQYEPIKQDTNFHSITDFNELPSNIPNYASYVPISTHPNINIPKYFKPATSYSKTVSTKPKNKLKYGDFYVNNHIGKSPEIVNVPIINNDNTLPKQSFTDSKTPYNTVTTEVCEDIIMTHTKTDESVPKVDATTLRPNEGFTEIPCRPIENAISKDLKDILSPCSNLSPQTASYLSYNPHLDISVSNFKPPNPKPQTLRPYPMEFVQYPIDNAKVTHSPTSYTPLDNKSIKYSGYKNDLNPIFKTPNKYQIPSLPLTYTPLLMPQADIKSSHSVVTPEIGKFTTISAENIDTVPIPVISELRPNLKHTEIPYKSIDNALTNSITPCFKTNPVTKFSTYPIQLIPISKDITKTSKYLSSYIPYEDNKIPQSIIKSPYDTVSTEICDDNINNIGAVPKLDTTLRPNDEYTEIPYKSIENLPLVNSIPEDILKPCLKTEPVISSPYPMKFFQSPGEVTGTPYYPTLYTPYDNSQNIKYSGYKTYQPSKLPVISPQIYRPEPIPTIRYQNPILDTLIQNQSPIPNDLITLPCQTELNFNDKQQTSKLNEYTPIESGEICEKYKEIDNELKSSLVKYINSKEQVKSELYNKDNELIIPIGDLAIADKAPISNNIIETNNPSIGLKVWKSNVKIVKAELKLKFKQLSVNNFMPVVNNLDEYDVEEIRKIVKSYIDEKYGSHIEVNEPYSVDNQYTVLNNFDFNAVDNKFNILWPPNYV